MRFGLMLLIKWNNVVEAGHPAISIRGRLGMTTPWLEYGVELLKLSLSPDR